MDTNYVEKFGEKNPVKKKSGKIFDLNLKGNESTEKLYYAYKTQMDINGRTGKEYNLKGTKNTYELYYSYVEMMFEIEKLYKKIKEQNKPASDVLQARIKINKLIERAEGLESQLSQNQRWVPEHSHYRSNNG